jgi:hypothetical protein
MEEYFSRIFDAICNFIDDGGEGTVPGGEGTSIKYYKGFGYTIKVPESIAGRKKTESWQIFWNIFDLGQHKLFSYWLGYCWRRRFFRSPKPGDPKTSEDFKKVCHSNYVPAKQKPKLLTVPSRLKEANIGSPFHLPRFTSDEFEEKKRKYIEKNGYKVIAPYFSDIVHFPIVPDISPGEWKYYYRCIKEGKEPDLPEIKKRYCEARYMRYQRMLASPVPKWRRCMSAILGAIDDAEDALTVGAIAGRFAIKAAPRLLGRFVPVLGWMLLADDILNLMNLVGRLPFGSRMVKRRFYDFFHKNPFARKVNLVRAHNFLSKGPGIGAWLEAAQVLDNVIGVGLCLGPIYGYLDDVFFGWVRTIAGQRVDWSEASPVPYPHERTVVRGLKAQTVLSQVNPLLTDEERMMSIISYFLSLQLISGYFGEHNIMSVMNNLDELEVRAPVPSNPMAIEMLKDHGFDPEEHAVWPQTESKWGNIAELIFTGAGEANRTFVDYCLRNNKNWEGYCTGQIAFDAHILNMECLEGKGCLYADYDHRVRHAFRLLQSGYRLAPGNDPVKVKKWWDWCTNYARTYDEPMSAEFLRMTASANGVILTTKSPVQFDETLKDLIPNWQILNEDLIKYFSEIKELS